MLGPSRIPKIRLGKLPLPLVHLPDAQRAAVDMYPLVLLRPPLLRGLASRACLRQGPLSGLGCAELAPFPQSLFSNMLSGGTAAAASTWGRSVVQSDFPESAYTRLADEPRQLIHFALANFTRVLRVDPLWPPFSCDQLGTGSSRTGTGHSS